MTLKKIDCYDLREIDQKDKAQIMTIYLNKKLFAAITFCTVVGRCQWYQFCIFPFFTVVYTLPSPSINHLPL